MMSIAQRLKKLKLIEARYEEQQELITDCLTLLSQMQRKLPRLACDGVTPAAEYKGPLNFCACTGHCIPLRTEIDALYDRAFKEAEEA